MVVGSFFSRASGLGDDLHAGLFFFGLCGQLLVWRLLLAIGGGVSATCGLEPKLPKLKARKTHVLIGGSG